MKILGKKVDGYCEETRTVYQLNGCFWHGCPECMAQYVPDAAQKALMKARLDRTAARERELIAAGYNVVRMWEHDLS